jgi:hypothetical protein
MNIPYGPSEMAFEIHSPVKNPDDVDTTIGHSIE